MMADQQPVPEPSETTPLVVKIESAENIESSEPVRGVSAKAAVHIAGAMAGAGVLALPWAISRTGWLGFPLIIVTSLMSLFSNARLWDCWGIVKKDMPGLDPKAKNMYATITEMALGKKLSVVVLMALVVAKFAMAVVYVLLAAQLLHQVFLAVTPVIGTCWWNLIVSGALAPIVYFGIPKNTSSVSLVAFISAIIACIAYFIQMMSEIKPFVFHWGVHGFTEFFLAVGVIMCAFGGTAVLPSIKTKAGSSFVKSLPFSYAASLLMYLPIALGSYLALGEAVAPNLAVSLSASALTLAANLFMSVHMLSAFILITEPLCQDANHIYTTDTESFRYAKWVRLSVMLMIIFTAETLTRYYPIMALVGGSVVATVTLVLPCYLYIVLSAIQVEGGEAPSGGMRAVCWTVATLGAAAGLLAVYSALAAMFSIARAAPCYLR